MLLHMFLACWTKRNAITLQLKKKKAFCSGVWSRKIQVLFNWYKSCCFYWPCNFEVSFEEKGIQTRIDLVDLAFTIIWSWDQGQKKDLENHVANHLSPLQTKDVQTKIVRETFLDEQLYMLHSSTRPWYADLMNYLVTKEFPSGLSKYQKDKLRANAKYYFWNTLYLWKFCADEVDRRCVPHDEFHSILIFCHSHSYGGGFFSKKNSPQGTWKWFLLAFYI